MPAASSSLATGRLEVERVADVLRAALADTIWTEQRMFGGVAFMVDGHMAAGASPHGVLLRVGPQGQAALPVGITARPLVIGGRTMRNFVLIDPDGLAADTLKSCLACALETVRALPPKAGAAGDRRKTTTRLRRPQR